MAEDKNMDYIETSALKGKQVNDAFQILYERIIKEGDYLNKNKNLNQGGLCKGLCNCWFLYYTLLY